MNGGDTYHHARTAGAGRSETLASRGDDELRLRPRVAKRILSPSAAMSSRRQLPPQGLFHRQVPNDEVANGQRHALPRQDANNTGDLAKVAILYPGDMHVLLDNVPREMVEQFMLSVSSASASATGTEAAATPPAPQSEPAASVSRFAVEALKLLGSGQFQDGGDVHKRRKASLARFLNKRQQRAEEIAPYPLREIPAATIATLFTRSKEPSGSMEKPSGSPEFRTTRTKNCDYDALDTDLRI